MIEAFKAQHFAEIISLRAQIEATVENLAFFNWPESTFKDEIARARVWVSRDSQSSDMNGFVIFRDFEDRFEVMVLGTSPEYQKQGVMTKTLQKLQLVAAERGKQIGLEVHEKNESARRLYLKLGFKLLRCRRNYYKDGAAAELYLWESPS